MVTPIGRVRERRDGDWTMGDGRPGPVTLRIRQSLVDLHHSDDLPDPEGWLHLV
ncbi:hypothetical protein ACFU5N_17275 [Streptomyces albidoflavus]